MELKIVTVKYNRKYRQLHIATQNKQTFSMFDEHKSKRSKEFIIFLVRIDTIHQFRTGIFHGNISHSKQAFEMINYQSRKFLKTANKIHTA